MCRTFLEQSQAGPAFSNWKERSLEEWDQKHSKVQATVSA